MSITIRREIKIYPTAKGFCLECNSGRLTFTEHTKSLRQALLLGEYYLKGYPFSKVMQAITREDASDK